MTPANGSARSPAPADSGATSAPADLKATPLWILANIEELVTALLLGIMIGSVGLSVFCRYVLQMPLSWTEEVVLLCMVWVCFLGASMATKHKEHIVIDIVVILVPAQLAKAMEVVSLSVVGAVLALLVWQGVLLVGVTQDVATTALGIPTMYIYAAVPVSGLLMFIHNSRHLLLLLRHR
jgi:TRAP-type C4-dicarboxylate transport system permease small subunit